MKRVQYITRKGSADIGHRVMRERVKCFNMHGHTYLFELTFEYHEPEEIGYAIDFKEIKRRGCQWIDDILDHGFALNPHDELLLTTCVAVRSKYWLMSLNGVSQFCNPTVENLSKEIFLAMEILFSDMKDNLRIHQIRLYETPNCYTDCYRESISELERANFISFRFKEIDAYRQKLGTFEYDESKVPESSCNL